MGVSSSRAEISMSSDQKPPLSSYQTHADGLLKGSEVNDGINDLSVRTCSNAPVIMKPLYATNVPGNSITISVPANDAADGQVAVKSAVDWNGVWLDTGALLGAQIAVCGI